MSKLPHSFSRLLTYHIHRTNYWLLGSRQVLSTIPSFTKFTNASLSTAYNTSTSSSYKKIGSLLCAGVKTSTTAAKRFIRMGSGVLKHGHAGTIYS